MEKILVIDDDRIVRKVFSHILTSAGYVVVEAEDGSSGLDIIRNDPPDLVLTDYQMPGLNGLDVLSEIHKMGVNIPVVMLTGYGDVMLTIKSVQEGAFDYIEKPADQEKLRSTVRKALDSYKDSKILPGYIMTEEERTIYLKNNVLVGKSDVMKSLFKNIGAVSLNMLNVFIKGESGTGKEHVANLIHIAGVTKDKPFVKLNCSSLTGLSADQIKSELEEARGGTLFLKEVSDMTYDVQLKLLDVLQGFGNDELRVVSASSCDIDSLIQKRQFSEDLYYRLKVFMIEVPPLRERKEDIPELVIHLLYKLGRRYNKNVSKLAKGVNELLKGYNWPGNVRELENTIMQGIITSTSDVLDANSIKISKQKPEILGGKDDEITSLANVEKSYIFKILNKVKWNKVEASRILGITRPTLNAKIEKYGLKKQ